MPARCYGRGACSRATSTSCASRVASSGTSDAIDLSADARAWPQVADARLTELVAGLLRGGGGRGRAPRTLRRRRRRRVLRGPAARRGAPRALLRPLRGGGRARRPARARVAPSSSSCSRSGCRRRSRARRVEAVGLYHMVLEGVVFTAGQLRAARARSTTGCPACAQGMELVLRDERWHVGFGTRCLADARLTTQAGDPRRGRARRGAVGARAGRARVDGLRSGSAAGGMAAVAVKLETEEIAGRRARARVPARRARLGRAVARLPGRGWPRATGRRALIYSRAGHGQSDVPGRRPHAALHARGGAGRPARRCSREHGHRAAGARRPQRRRLDRAHPRVRSTRSAGSSCSRRTCSSRT